MKEGVIKRMLPRSLYGRAALILLVPILTLQFVVSVVFIQRHFEGVTRQMTRGVIAELTLILDSIDASEDVVIAKTALEPLEVALDIAVTLPQVTHVVSARPFYDLSGRTIQSELAESFPNLNAVDLGSSSKLVILGFETHLGPVTVEVLRARVSASNPHQLLVLMIFTGLLMTLIAFLFLRNQLRPIRRLAFAADAFGKGKDMTYKPTGATEVRLAGNAFLDMKNRIERQIEQRTMMLSGVSHDLRTPLTRLKLALSLADDTDDTEAMRKDVSEMERMLDTFLDFARGSMVEETVSTNPAELVDRVVDGFTRSGGVIEVTCSTDTPLVLLKEVAVERALQNLLGNALRYGTKARVGLSVGQKAIVISVEDDGPGIPEDQRIAAVKAFSRLDTARNQNSGTGVGLGLAIAADVARSHGGLLRLGESKELGGLKAELVLAR
ncbi:ATP-binding protein [Actibacterium pelagium]|uniref:histidine kinase n=1 Tax=Actibacterium pelagium TaxID=2029103 RepID=A0A917AE26_9RHOB|nr:ATP-binding protein [Actibacterium pelagium]GGE43568.1 two-component sensor histidine kinase [Actibacterium pelagium]